MLKRFLCSTLIGVLLLGSATTAYADEITIDDTSDYSSVSTVASVMTVTNVVEDLPLLGDGIVVEIPSSLPLSYDRDSYTHNCEATVGVRGDISEFAMVYVYVDEALTYTLSTDDTVTLDGTVTYGYEPSNKEGYLLETWTASQCAEGKDDATLTNRRDLAISASSLLAPVGSYESEVTFCIEVDYVGLTDIPSDYNAFDFDTGNTNDTFLYYYAYGQQARFEDGALICNDSYINFIDDNLASDAARMRCLKFNHSELISNNTIKYIYMDDSIKQSSGNTPVVPILSSRYNAIDDIQSWIMNLNALEVIYLKKNLPPKSLHSYIGNSISSHDWAIDTCYNDTDIIIGNALVFCKGIDENDKCIYVPHIVYEGTMSEWIALADNGYQGATDWVFGNAANVVTVHCADGTLQY